MQPMNYILGATQAPYSYKDTIDIQNSALAQKAATLANEQQQNLIEAQRQVMLEKEAEMVRKKQMQADFAAVSALEKPTLMDYVGLSTRYPEVAKEALGIYDSLKAPQKQDLIFKTNSVYHALANGRPALAEKIINEEIAASENSNSPESVEGLKQILASIRENPAGARSVAGYTLGYLTSKDGKPDPQFLKAQEEIYKNTVEQPYDIAYKQAQTAKELASVEKTMVETANVPVEQQSKNALRDAQIANYVDQISNRGLQYGLDKEKLYQDVLNKKNDLTLRSKQNLSSTAEKQINESVGKAAKYEQDAKYMEDLAVKFSQAPISAAGAPGKASEFYKSTIGGQNKITELRQEFDRIINMGVLDMLPPGSASNYDVQTIRSGFPKATDNPEGVARFLKSLANIKRVEANLENRKSDWISQNGSLGTARSDVEIEGVLYPRGSKFSTFIQNTSMKQQNSSTTQQPNQPSFLKYGR
jgi:hypothetical protein